MANFRDLDIDELLEWPLNAQLTVIVLVMVVIQVIGYGMYLSPKQEALEGLNQQEQSLKSLVRIKANKVAALPQLQTQLDELAERYDFYCANSQHSKSWPVCLLPSTSWD